MWYLKQEKAEMVFGAILFVLANLLAFVFGRSEFYILIFLGLFFIMKGAYKQVNGREFLDMKWLAISYALFFAAGVIIDFLMGVKLFEIWTYPGYSALSYLVLYLAVYPLGGLVVMYSFALVESMLSKKQLENNRAYRQGLLFSKTLMFISIGGILFSIFLPKYNGFFALAFILLIIYGLIDFVALKMRREDSLEKSLIRPLQYALLVLFWIYIQIFTRKFPSILSKSWTLDKIPASDITFFGVPIMVAFIGAISLVVLPYAIYELVVAWKALKK